MVRRRHGGQHPSCDNSMLRRLRQAPHWRGDERSCARRRSGWMSRRTQRIDSLRLKRPPRIPATDPFPSLGSILSGTGWRCAIAPARCCAPRLPLRSSIGRNSIFTVGKASKTLPVLGHSSIKTALIPAIGFEDASVPFDEAPLSIQSQTVELPTLSGRLPLPCAWANASGASSHSGRPRKA